MEYCTQFCKLPKDIRNRILKANIYYSEEYFNHNSNCKVFYFYDKNRIIVAVYRKKFQFRFLSLPSEPFVWNDSNISSEDTFLNELISKCKDLKCIDWIGPTEVQALFKAAPCGAEAIPFGSHIVTLDNTEENLWSAVHSKHRNVIRKASKDGVEISLGGKELLPLYMIADEQTWARSNLDICLEKEYRTLLEDFPNNVNIFIATLDSKIQGGAIFLYNSQRVYYLYGASVNDSHTGAMNLLHWEAMKYYKNKGVHEYSFVGCRINEDADSKFHGIQRFKERFGGTLNTGVMFKVILHPWKYKLYLCLKRLKDKNYMDIVDQEKSKWKDNI